MAKAKKRRWILWLLLIIAAIVLGYMFYKSKNKPKGIEVTTEKVKRNSINETVSASGRIFPETEVKISSDVSGEIVELFVAEGDSVVVGQILAKIDPESYVSAVERGEAGLNSSKAQMSMSRSQIENSRAQVEQIRAQMKNAEAIHSRNSKLKSEGVISEVEFEQSLASLDGLKASLRAAEAGLRSSEESAKASEYSTKSAAASLKELKTSLNRTTIKAPTSGIVSSLSVEQGERVVGTIQMTGTEMMRIANLNTMEVQVEVSENDIVKVTVGDSVDIEVDAYLDKIFGGEVTEIANSASNTATAAISLNTDQVTNFIVKIRVDASSYEDLISENRKYPFRPGMSAAVDVYTDIAKDVITVPIQAVTVRDINANDEDKEEEIKEVVFVMDADTARMIQVVTGIQDDENIFVTSGLEEDMEVVSGPYSAVSKEISEGGELRLKEEKDNKKKK